MRMIFGFEDVYPQGSISVASAVVIALLDKVLSKKFSSWGSLSAESADVLPSVD